jgi:hypothetical protein
MQKCEDTLSSIENGDEVVQGVGAREGVTGLF